MTSLIKSKHLLLQKKLLQDAETEVEHYLSWLEDLNRREHSTGDPEATRHYVLAKLAEAEEALETAKQILRDMEEAG